MHHLIDQLINLIKNMNLSIADYIFEIFLIGQKYGRTDYYTKIRGPN